MAIAAQPTLAAEDETGEAGQAASEDAPPVFGMGWLDDTQSIASDSANALARQLDRFFGVQRSDIEAAYSSLRFTTIHSWNPEDRYDTGVRLRGKLHLPRINERVSVIFSEEDGDGTNYYNQDSASVASEETTRANLEFNLADKGPHHLFFRVGGHSGLKGKLSMRYRYDPESGGRNANRFTQAFYFKDGDGLGSFSRYQFDHSLNEESLLRWTNELRLEEDDDGSRYRSSLEYLALRSNKTALSWYGRINGETRPGFIKSYDLGVRFRKNIYREWLYLELEPGYTWRKEDYGEPRKGIPFVFLRLEMAIGSYKR